MNKKIIIIIISCLLLIGLVMGYFVLYRGADIEKEDQEKVTLEEAGRIAEKWIKDYSPTYRERGGKNLELVSSREADDPIYIDDREDAKIIEINEGVYEFVFKFDTEETGYGVFGEDEEVLPIETEREVVVRTAYSQIYDVIVDGTYNEVKRMYVGEYEELLPYKEELNENATLEEVKENAINWIKIHAGTYRERGGRGLEFLESEDIDSFFELDVEANEVKEITDGVRKLVFNFQTDYEGFGPLNEGETRASEPVDREIEVHMVHNQLKRAVTDGSYDEKNADYVENITEYRPYKEELDKNATLEEVKENAINWIKIHAGTYRGRGGRGLEFLESEDLDLFNERDENNRIREITDGVRRLVFKFQTDYEGFGPLNKGETRASEPVDREIEVHMVHNQLKRAVTDGSYDEKNADYVENAARTHPYNVNLDKNATLEEIEENAMNWIIFYSPTYRGRGEKGGLELVSSKKLDEPMTIYNPYTGEIKGKRGNVYELVFSFKARYDGYGPVEDNERPKEGSFQREMVIKTVHNIVEDAVTDNTYNERRMRYVDEL